MLTELQHRFDAVEHQRIALKAAVSPLSDLQLSWKLEPGSWNILQIVQHLVLSDETVGRIKEVGEMEAEAPLFRLLPRALRRAMIISALRHDIVLPLPSPDMEPSGSISLGDLLARWHASRSDMGSVLETLRADADLYSHPVLGPLTAAQMLDLGRVHTAYHMRQMQVLQRARQFPS